MTILGLVMRPELVEQALKHFREVQTTDIPNFQSTKVGTLTAK